jgi:mersacidin/lichenicidin family type 2 lantibiotic
MWEGDIMSNVDVVRAWKDAEYRRSLTEEQRALLPEHPAGLIELHDEEMKGVLGGTGAFCSPHTHHVCNTLFGTCTC